MPKIDSIHPWHRDCSIARHARVPAKLISMRLIDLLRTKGLIDESDSRDDGSGSDQHTNPPLTRHGETMKLIPWEDIWTSLRVARIRGNGEMIDVFYDTLFKEAVFDDDGAWSIQPKPRS